jgi:O-antigen/teichoic acid export membrane protein
MVWQSGILLSFIHSAVLIREYKRLRFLEDRERLLALQLTCSLAGALIFSIVALVLLGTGSLPSEYAFAGWFYVPIVLLTAIQPVWVFQAEEKQHFQSFLAAFQPALTALLYASFFRPGMSAGSDLLVASAVTLCMTLVYWRAIRHWLPFRWSLVSWETLRSAWPLVKSSRWLYSAALAAFAYTTLELPLLGWLRSLEELGCYRTAVSLVGAAQAFLTIAPTLLYPRFIEWRQRGEELLWSRQKKLGVLFALGAVVASVTAFLVFPFLHPMVFGAPFRSAGFPAAILLTAKLLVMVHGVFIWGLRTDSNYDRSTSLVMIGAALFSVTGNLLFIPRFGMVACAWVNVTCEGLLLAVFFSMSVARMRRLRMALSVDVVSAGTPT